MFELEEGRVAQIETLLDTTKENVRNHARSAVDRVTSLGGGGWSGTAFTAANAAQTENFLPAMTRIEDELALLRDNLTGSRQKIAAQEEANVTELQNSNFGRL